MEESYKSMRINAPKGQKVIFKGAREGLWGGGHADNRVEKTKVFGSHSEVVFAEIPNAEFNTVMFAEWGEVLEPTKTEGELYRQGVEERRLVRH